MLYVRMAAHRSGKRSRGLTSYNRAVKILALDTSTEYCSVALLDDGAIDARETRAGHSHSELLLPMIDELLASRDLRLHDLTGIAYGRGPGSFTGLRIACGVVQGLAFGAELPVVGVDTLLAMAAGIDATRVLCCVDARVREIYHAAYENRGGEWRAVSEPALYAPHAVPDLPQGEWLACGNAFSVYGDVLLERYRGQLAGIDTDAFPHAREIARLAAPYFDRGETLSAEEAAPVYLREKVALRIDERANR